MFYMKDIGHQIATEIGNVPAARTAGTADGTAVERTGYQSAVLYVMGGNASGTPSAQTLDASLQESATGTSAWTAITNAAITQITADGGDAKVSVDLSTAKKYIRSSIVTAFTDGSTPAWPCSASLILGGASTLPTS